MPAATQSDSGGVGNVTAISKLKEVIQTPKMIGNVFTRCNYRVRQSRVAVSNCFGTASDFVP